VCKTGQQHQSICSNNYLIAYSANDNKIMNYFSRRKYVSAVVKSHRQKTCQQVFFELDNEFIMS